MKKYVIESYENYKEDLMKNVFALKKFSAPLKSITRYLGVLFFKITAVPCSSTNLATLEKFWFASVMEIIEYSH